MYGAAWDVKALKIYIFSSHLLFLWRCPFRGSVCKTNHSAAFLLWNVQRSYLNHHFIYFFNLKYTKMRNATLATSWNIFIWFDFLFQIMRLTLEGISFQHRFEPLMSLLTQQEEWVGFGVEVGEVEPLDDVGVHAGRWASPWIIWTKADTDRNTVMVIFKTPIFFSKYIFIEHL